MLGVPDLGVQRLIFQLMSDVIVFYNFVESGTILVNVFLENSI